MMNGRLMSVCVADDNSHLAFSAASRSRCSASLSLDRSMPCAGHASAQHLNSTWYALRPQVTSQGKCNSRVMITHEKHQHAATLSVNVVITEKADSV